MNQKNKFYLLSVLCGAAATFILTIVVYGLFLSSYNLSSLNYGVHALSCIANGFYVATILRWGKFKGMKNGSVVGALISFLTDAYFIGVSVAMFGTITVIEGLLQVCIWSLINAVVGAIAAAVQKTMWDSNEITADRICHDPFFSRKTDILHVPE